MTKHLLISTLGRTPGNPSRLTTACKQQVLKTGQHGTTKRAEVTCPSCKAHC